MSLAATSKKHPTNTSFQRAVQRTWTYVSTAILITCAMIGFIGTLGGAVLLNSLHTTTYKVVNTQPLYAGGPLGAEAALAPLSSAFTPEVLYWAPLIQAWAVVYQIDPNLIATVIQIESCGDPQIASPAGAQGLFQVMPFHFAAGEDMLDVQTNARRGLDYLLGGLEQAEGHVGLALAGYNGGHGVIKRGWASWASETRRYYYWGSRIYAEAIAGMETSPTLQEWLQTGGVNLCARAQQSQQQIEQQARLAVVSTN
jgi:hypothetical protein